MSNIWNLSSDYFYFLTSLYRSACKHTPPFFVDREIWKFQWSEIGLQQNQKKQNFMKSSSKICWMEGLENPFHVWTWPESLQLLFSLHMQMIVACTVLSISWGKRVYLHVLCSTSNDWVREDWKTVCARETHTVSLVAIKGSV